MKKLTIVTKIANQADWGGIALGENLKFFAKRVRDYETGELDLKNILTTFCYGDFAKAFGLKVRDIKRLFVKDTLYNIRLTIEVLEEEEWKYTK